MLIPLIILTLFGTISCAVLALLGKRRASVMETRIQDFRNRAVTRDEFGPDLDLAFSERVLKPSIENLAHVFSRVLPQSVLADVQKQLMMAGNPISFNSFMAFWAISLLAFGGFAAIVVVSLGPGYLPQKALGSLVFVVIGFSFPRMWLKGKVKSKQKMVVRALPDTMDLITTCVEAGLGLDAALSRVADTGEGPLADELSHMLRDIAMGKLRREAMLEMSERVGVDELSSFVNSIVQAEQLGVGIAQVLRVQSDQLRTQRRQRAERLAHEAPIKMLFPLVLFVFPAFLAVILGPAVIRIMDAF